MRPSFHYSADGRRGDLQSGKQDDRHTQTTEVVSSNDNVGKLIVCPTQGQFLEVYTLIDQNDGRAARKAMDEYGCKAFQNLTEVKLSDSTAGFNCFRPRGEPHCLWTLGHWIDEAHLR